MDKTYKCDRCRCQDICKLETAFRNTQDKLDEIVENGNVHEGGAFCTH